jgi:hypothetical protein
MTLLKTRRKPLKKLVVAFCLMCRLGLFGNAQELGDRFGYNVREVF